MTLQYRAVLNDPGNTTLEKTPQIFASDLKTIDEWAAVMLPSAISDNAAVVIYRSTEVELCKIPKVKKAAGGAV